MKPPSDPEMLSAYMDGEIDPDAVDRMESLLHEDPESRRYIIDAVKTTARLRAVLNPTLKEEIPDRLLQAAVPRRGKRGFMAGSRRPLLLAAASLFLVLVGFGSGIFFNRGPGMMEPMLAPAIPEQYSHVIHDALEYDLSGATRKWEADNVSLTVLVMPVKTYRGPTGAYFREYRLEIITKTKRDEIRGLAYRDARGAWITKALMF